MQALAPPVNNKYFKTFSVLIIGRKPIRAKNAFSLEQQIYLRKLDNLQYSIGVKHRLRNSVEFLRSIQAPYFIISTIETSYVSPFVNVPSDLYLKNNLPACNNEYFVSGAVSELFGSGCVHRVPFKPIVVNPLSVAENRSGNKSLTSDRVLRDKAR